MTFIDPLTHEVAVEGNEGNMTTFTCTVVGIHEPSIIWSANTGERINISIDPAVMERDSGHISVTSTFTISSLMSSDAGQYTCTTSIVVAGSVWKAVRVFTLRVNCECDNGSFFLTFNGIIAIIYCRRQLINSAKNSWVISR